jgi:hypothetical protein
LQTNLRHFLNVRLIVNNQNPFWSHKLILGDALLLGKAF